jgi:hypothetical protein
MRSLIPQFSHVLVGNCSPFVAEALRYVVGDRSNFRVGVNPAESRHREDARRGMPRRSRYNDLGDICCMRIVYCPGAGNGSVGRNRTDAGPIVATYTGAFKNPSAENVRSFTALLGQRRSRRGANSTTCRGNRPTPAKTGRLRHMR